MADLNETGGLFGSGDASLPEPTAKRTKKGPAERREKLFAWESVASQTLNPYGPSALIKKPLPTFWTAIANGNKGAMYHSELAAKGDDAEADYRIGVGLSRVAGTISAGIAVLERPEYRQLLKEDLLRKALAEGETLKPHLAILDAGKGSNSTSGQGFSSLKKQSASNVARTNAEIERAVAAIVEWVSKPESALRTMLNYLSGDGAFFSAFAAERTLRGCVHCKPATAEDLSRAARARLSGSAPASSSAAAGDQGGLFDA